MVPKDLGWSPRTWLGFQAGRRLRWSPTAGIFPKTPRESPRSHLVPEQGGILGSSPKIWDRPQEGKLPTMFPKTWKGPQEPGIDPKSPGWSPSRETPRMVPRCKDGPKGALDDPKGPQDDPMTKPRPSFSPLPMPPSSSMPQAPPQKMAPTTQKVQGATMGNVWVHNTVVDRARRAGRAANPVHGRDPRHPERGAGPPGAGLVPLPGTVNISAPPGSGRNFFAASPLQKPSGANGPV